MSQGGVLIRDLESKVSLLERSNFDLKMQIYYLNEKLASQNSGGARGPDDFDMGPLRKSLAERDVALESVSSLQETNKAQSKRIAALELELSMAQAQLKGCASVASLGDPLLLEENRKRERSAMQAVAEHDAQIIAELEETVKKLQAQNNRDMALVSNCTSKVAGLIEELEKKDVTILAHSDAITALQKSLDVANARVKQQDVLLLQRSNLAQQAANPNPNPVNAVVLPPSPIISKPARSENVSGREFLDFGAQQAWDELSKLRQQNQSMAEELDKRAGVIKTQEEALRRVKATVEDITILEAEEIARLEKQLEVYQRENDFLRKKSRESDLVSKVNKSKADVLEAKLTEMESLQDEMVTMISDREDFIIAQQQNSSSTPFFGSSSNSPKTASRAISTSYDDEVIRQYRVREAELINALEGLVSRCHVLEKQQKRQQQNH